jgi:hypothetical protein
MSVFAVPTWHFAHGGASAGHSLSELDRPAFGFPAALSGCDVSFRLVGGAIGASLASTVQSSQRCILPYFWPGKANVVIGFLAAFAQFAHFAFMVSSFAICIQPRTDILIGWNLIMSRRFLELERMDQHLPLPQGVCLYPCCFFQRNAKI